jgi:hypothetical protein
MGQGRFLNQKLGKRFSRRQDLLKSKIRAGEDGRAARAVDTRLPKKGSSRQHKRSGG